MNKTLVMIVTNLFIISLSTTYNNFKRNEFLYYENEPISSYRIYDDYYGYENNQNSSRGINDVIIPINPVLPTATQTYLGNPIFTKYYFSNLLNNFPSNYDGICGYTALTMLLSYYDTFWNNNFIDSSFTELQNPSYITDFNDISNNFVSPGVRDYYISVNDYVDDSSTDQELELEILNWIAANKNEGTFLGHLLDLAVQTGVLETNSIHNGNYLRHFAVNYNIMVGLLINYINTLPFSNINIISIDPNNTFSRSQIREQIIYYLKKGIPLCVGGGSYRDVNNNETYDRLIDELSGHVVVAYEYDEANDIIYCHLGWGSRNGWVRYGYPNSYTENFLRANLDDYFNYDIADYCGIDITNNSSILHSHNTNYINSNTNTNDVFNVCSCKLDSHFHSYIYRLVNSTQHTKTCYCTSVPILENHSFYYSYINGIYIKKCGMCNYSEEV